MTASPDTLIIGGGVMGSAIGLRLARAGQRVLVLERAVPGAEASSAAGGILGAQVEAREDGPLARLCLSSRGLWSDFAAEILEASGGSIGYTRCGTLEVAANPAELDAAEAERAWQRIQGHPIERLRRADLLELEPCIAADAAGALHFPRDAQVDAQALAEALPAAARAAGVSFRQATVERVRVEGDRARGVVTADGALDADAVVVAAGAWTSRVEGLGLAEDAVRPMRGQMVELALDGRALTHIVFSAEGYVIPRALDPSRVLCGSTEELVGFVKQVTASGLHRILGAAMRTVPVLGAAEVARSWAGFRPCPRDGLPLIGSTPVAGLFVASGHHRNGILLTPVTADLVADAVLERAATHPTIDPAPFRPSRLWAAPAP